MAKVRSMLRVLADGFIVKALSSWLAVSASLLLCFPQKEVDLHFAEGISLTVAILPIVTIYIALTVADHSWKAAAIPRWFLYGSLFVFSASLVSHHESIQTYLFLSIVLVLAIRHLYTERPLMGEQARWIYWLPLIAVAMACFITTTTIAVLRYETYGAPNFDFGIFCQMFHYMKTDLVPNTTCERDQLLSHFAVHISPIFYVLLPVYMVFPTPITLAVGQVAVLFSGLIPVYLLCKRRGLSPVVTMLAAITFAAYPALSGGCMYDIHENCFLVPLLLWMFYFYEKRSTLGTLLLALGVCMVKEDAFLYVAIFAVYVLFDGRRLRLGALLLGGSLLYFVGAVYLLTTFGEGIMSTGRFGNLIPEGGGLLDVVKLFLTNPGFVMGEIFAPDGDKQQKLLYAIQLLVPLGLLPFFSKKSTRYLLILPIIINLMTDYSYMHNWHFQYGFGVIAFFVYGAVLNLSDMPERRARCHSLVAATLSLLLFIMSIAPLCTSQLKNYRENHEKYAQMDAVLDCIPPEASVTASTFLMPHLSNRDELYEVYYHGAPSSDYLVLDIRGGWNTDNRQYAQTYEEAGYAQIYEKEGQIAILAKPGAPALKHPLTAMS